MNNWKLPQWQAWIAGQGLDEMKHKLLEVPEQYREEVTRHARTVWKIGTRGAK